MFLLLVIAAAGVLGACAVNPATGRNDFVLMSERDEIRLGRDAHAEIVKQFGGAYADPELQAYVQRVGARLAANSHRGALEYHFTVLDSPEVNAFALPGGYVYITRGLLAYLNSEAEMAAVLGHEIGHVTARHSVRQISGTRAAQIGYSIGSIFVPELRSQVGQGLFNVLGGAITSGYGREHELEADRLGAEYLARSGYDPQAMLMVLGVLKDQELFERQLAREEGREPKIYHGVFASHPSSDQRLQEVVGLAGTPEVEVPTAPSGEDYLHFIDGMVYGDGERAGVVRAGVFYHARLGVAFTLPSGWTYENLPERLVLLAPQKKAVLQVTVDDRPRQATPREYLRARFKSKPGQEEAIRSADLEGYTAVIEVGRASARNRERITVIFHDDHAYVFTGVTRQPGEFERFDAEFSAVTTGFHPLSAQEQNLAAALRIRVRPPSADLDWASLARRSPLQGHAEEQLRLLNQLYPDGVPAPGTRLKVVE